MHTKILKITQTKSQEKKIVKKLQEWKRKDRNEKKKWEYSRI